MTINISKLKSTSKSLPLEKALQVILIRSVFNNNNKFYP